LEKTTNDKIREITKVETTIVEEIQRRQVIWYGHVERLEDTKIPKQILKWTPTEKRKIQGDMDRQNRKSYVGTKPATRGLGRQKSMEARNRKAQDAMKPDMHISRGNLRDLTFGYGGKIKLGFFKR